MADAGNDWWWAIDNIQVFSPLTLQVDAQTGQMQILGDASAALKGYEIVSPSGSLAPAGWTVGNLDAQGVGNATPAATDFDSSNSVDATDLAIWNSAYATTGVADSDLDSDSDGADFLRWQRKTDCPAIWARRGRHSSPQRIDSLKLTSLIARRF